MVVYQIFVYVVEVILDFIVCVVDEVVFLVCCVEIV